MGKRSLNYCGSCGKDLPQKEARFVCVDCGSTMCSEDCDEICHLTGKEHKIDDISKVIIRNAWKRFGQKLSKQKKSIKDKGFPSEVVK